MQLSWLDYSKDPLSLPSETWIMRGPLHLADKEGSGNTNSGHLTFNPFNPWAISPLPETCIMNTSTHITKDLAIMTFGDLGE